MKTVQKGFTLIELMIVVAIIAILAAIALPAYNSYRVKSAHNACLGEAKAFANAYVAASLGGMTADIPQAPNKACSAGGANGEFTAQEPAADKKVTCNMSTGSCALGTTAP